MKKKTKIIIVLAVVLIATRITLPFIIKNQLNEKLAELPEYTGHVEDVDLMLIKGAFAVDNFTLDKTENQDTIPFVSVERTEVGLDFKALINGAVHAEIDVDEPTINFVASADTNIEQYGGDYLWFEELLKLQPIDINQITVSQGMVHFKNHDSNPKVNLVISEIEAQANNLRNVVEKDKKLPSSFNMTASVLNGGTLSTSAQMNILKEIPDMNLNVELEEVQFKELNNFLITYTGIDASNGELNMYSEMVVDNQQLDGYVKPLITDLEFINNNQDRSFSKKLKEGVSQLFVKLFQNQKKDQFASKIPVEGKVEKTDIAYLKAIGNVFVNAFIDAFEQEIDDTVDYPIVANK